MNALSTLSASTFTLIFLTALVVTTGIRLWLGYRHIRHIAAHRNTVPPVFNQTISLEAHHKAADYTTAKTKMGLIDIVIGALFVSLLTVGGILQWLYSAWQNMFTDSNYAHGILFIASLAAINLIIELPLSLYRTFVIEQRFGFNKMTWRLFILDCVKGMLLSALIGLPVILAVLWLMQHMGPRWWLTVWLFWLSFNLLVLLIYPSFIAPLFNKFTPLADTALRARIDALLAKCGFKSSGLFVMDGSKRSAHGNAYFTGFGAAKRIVFFDTLLERLTPEEIEAVLAHELGHYKHHHVWKRIALIAAASLAGLWLLSVLITAPWFYAGLGMTGHSTAAALVLFSIAMPLFTFPLAPMMSLLSRKHEYEADAYAARQTNAEHLINGLVKLYRDNASTLTPDPLHSSFYDSHPPASDRIRHLREQR